MNNINNNLTLEEDMLRGIPRTWEERVVGLPERPQERSAEEGLWVAVADMPKAYRRYYERQEAKRLRKKKRRERGGPQPGARKGRRHWRSKAKTLERRRQRRWARRPFDCILGMNKYRCKRLDRALWDRHVAPLWEQYSPEDLRVRFPHHSGTKADPWTLFNMQVVHKEKGRVFNGPDLHLYILSGGE